MRRATHDGPAVTTDQGAEELRRPLCNNDNIRILAPTGALHRRSKECKFLSICPSPRVCWSLELLMFT